MKKLASLLLVAALLMLAAGSVLAQDDALNDEPIRVGSKLDPEGIILANLILIALEDAGYAVEDRTPLGTTAVNRDALNNGEIDVYPEYTGTALNTAFVETSWAEIPEGAATDRVLGFATVSSFDAAINDVVWLQAAPANNTFAFAVTRQFAEENDVFTVDDLSAYINEGGEALMATSDEFAQRPDGIPSFENLYGFDFAEDQLLIIAGATPAQTEQALNEGANGVNMAMAYGTDGALMAYDFIVLEDTLGAQPIYAPAPIFRGEILRAYPEIAGILNPIFGLLDNPTLQGLNARVAVDGENPTDVARSWLEENGFIGG